MNFSFFMMPLHVPGDNPSLAFQRDIELIAYVDHLGFDEFWIGEHHSAGWETMPSPEMALAKASALAPRIRLGTSVISLPFHHPFHVAERMAFLDHLTNGRAILGVGQSNLQPDIKLFNIPVQDLRPMMFESIDIIVKLLESPEPISYEGRYWTINDMALQLRSYQQPRLPLGMATTGTRASIELAGKYGMIMLSPVGRTPPGGVPPAERWGVYAESAREHGHTPAKENMRAVSWFHLSDTREQAWDDVRETAMRDTHYFATIGGTAGYAEYPGQPFEEFNVESIAALRGWVIGTPDDAIEAIEKIDREAGGIGGIMLSTHEWVNSHKTNYSLELFARYVMPHFRGHTQDLKAAWRRTQADAAANALPGSGSGATGQAPSLDEHKSNLYLSR